MLSDHFVSTIDRPPPADEAFANEPRNEDSVLGLTELLLKDPDRLDRLARDASRQSLLIPAFLAVGLVSFSLFALALVLTLTAVPPRALP
ncbi:MAG TPA: hypothetical protein VH120_00990, partial [Gemmataceae bacterium]|nr:hypothetical protein [Gemmataceae bacterium]